MKRVLLLLFCLVNAISVFGQTPTQIKQIIPGTPSVQLAWNYNTSDEQYMDAFVAQRTAFSSTVTITSPYDVETVISQKTARQITYTMPTPAPVAGQRSFIRMVARKQGLADSAPSNVVQIDVVPTPPSPQNLNIARFTEVEFTRKNLGNIQLWVITKVL